MSRQRSDSTSSEPSALGSLNEMMFGVKRNVKPGETEPLRSSASDMHEAMHQPNLQKQESLASLGSSPDNTTQRRASLFGDGYFAASLRRFSSEASILPNLAPDANEENVSLLL
eukprot:Clim_evm114s149 gene=Clim_evmTU114s149